MENKIDITVIIPMYNSEKYIEKAITSIIHQEEHGLNYEIIIIDDFSNDNSCEVVKKINNDKIKLIELKKNCGTANARNTGIRIAKGEWIQFFDSDDRIGNDLYKKFELSKKPDINCYLFSLIVEYYDYNLKQKFTVIKDKRAFGHHNVIWNKFIKRDICIEFKKDYYFEDPCFIVDMMIEKDLKLSLINDAYYIYNRKNKNSKMANFNKKEYFKMYSYIYSQIDKCDDFTKMYILEMFVALLFIRNIPFLMSLYIATKTLLRLYKYLPRVYLNQNRHCVESIKIDDGDLLLKG